jgi:pyroglutamyl-peptidase
MQLLLTAFSAFADVEENPTVALLEELLARSGEWPALKVEGEVLPTEYDRAGARIAELLAERRPDIWIGFGVARNETAIRLERTARNWQDCETPDNSGELRRGVPIVEGGPPSYRSNLDLADLLALLTKDGLGARISDDAGHFVCNHVFYSALHQAASLGLELRAGFVHTPPRVYDRRFIDAIESCVLATFCVSHPFDESHRSRPPCSPRAATRRA